MLLTVIVIVATGLTLALVAAGLVVRRGATWGSTPDERAAVMPGDVCFSANASAFVRMTRAIDIDAASGTVWPWLAQMGRGAGWYSWDRLDNGSRKSAEHIVSWIPDARLGDATAIGYLKELVPGQSMTWWAPDLHYFGAKASLAVDILLAPAGSGSRLVIRMSAEGARMPGWVALRIFQFVDCIMATRQLVRFKQCAEAFGTRSENPADPETGDRDQYQLYQVIYASGEWAGVRGKELAGHWRRVATEAVGEGVESSR